MRPVKSQQDRLRYPLNDILGRESHVRILRFLSDKLEPVGVSVIAEETGITSTGTRKAIESLLEAGAIQEFGTQRQRQYALRAEDSLLRTLIDLFEEEQARHAELLRRVKEIAKNVEPPPTALWIETEASLETRRLELGFLAGVRDVDALQHALRKAMFDIESQFDVTIELQPYTDADIPFLDVEHVQPVYGYLRTADDGKRAATSSHASLDERARRWAKKLARFVREDPGLIPRSLDWLEVRLAEGAGTASRDLEDWRRILESYSKQQLMQYLTSETPRSHRLRQSSPLLAVLTKDQQLQLNDL